MGASGPRTPKGKAVARMNATRHGIYSSSPVIAALESEEDWNTYQRRLIEALAPDGFLEVMLAERVAVLSWRLLRVMRYERDAIATSQEKVADDLPEQLAGARSRLLEFEAGRLDRRMGEVNVDRSVVASIDATFPSAPVDTGVNRVVEQTDFLRRERLLPDEVTLNKVMRYEAHLSRQFYHALHELEALQTRRMGGASPLARLDVHGPADSPPGT